MGERIVKIKLLADASGAVQGFAAVRDSAAETKAKITESARSNRAEWATVGTGLTAVGVAVTGLGVAALKTGIQYNTLQQTTRAALATLLGSAQAANAQMDKLDEFARNSPFAKQTFISAQQQMLGFGVAAKDVIPALDAIQNAVAAMGGSNEQIAAISEIMSRIKSESRLSGDALQRLGYYGIDAAAIIGTKMGKTAAEIRDMARKPGGIPVEDIWEPLVSGLQDKFGGAAANVKNTFEGAMDRVKAAWRDFSSELAKPLVDPNGGGALVDLLNWAADAMRNFQKLPEPLKQTSTAIVGLTGAGALLLGTSMLLIPKWVEFTDALATFNVTGARARSVMQGLMPATLALALVPIAANLATWSDEMRGVTKTANELSTAMKRTRDFSLELDRGLAGGNPLRGLGNDAVIADNNLRALNTTAGEMKASFDNSMLGKAMSVSLLGFGRDAGNAKKQIEELDAALAQTVSSGQAAAAAKAYDEFAAKAKNAGWSQEKITEALPQYVSAQAEASTGTGLAANQFQEAADKASMMQAQIMRLVDAMVELNGVGRSAEKSNAALQSSFGKIQEYIAKAQEGLDGYSLSLDASTESGSRNRAMLSDHAAAVEADAFAQLELETRTIGAEQATASFIARMSAGNQQVYDAAIAMGVGASEAQNLANKLISVPDGKDVAIIVQGIQQAMYDLDTFQGRLDAMPKVIPISVALTSTDPKRLGLAYGGTAGYASGGTIGGAAFGKTIGGFGGGVAGGTVFGAGGTKSDSILVRLSRGEEVIQEPYASMYRKELKQMNRGDFVSQRQAPQVIVVQPDQGDRMFAPNLTIYEAKQDGRLLARQMFREWKDAI